MSSQLVHQQIQEIVRAIKHEEAILRDKWPLLAQQNSIAASVLLIVVMGWLSIAALYYFTALPSWVCIPLIAFLASIAHEIEHDLIHKQYFKKHKGVYHLMMCVVWVMRPNTINPWYRKKIHLHHHKVSGSKQDIEERLVGNGVKNLMHRVIAIMDGLIGLILSNARFKREITGFNFFKIFNAGVPLTTAYFALLYGFFAFHCFDFLYGGGVVYPDWLIRCERWAAFIMVIVIIPNIVRSVSLNLITSSMHYYGGVNHLLQQTHVLNHWLFMPFQWFCFNFGSTHTIHHFVPNQPFYIRHMIHKRVLPVLKQNGVRFNDLNSLRFANQFRPVDNKVNLK